MLLFNNAEFKALRKGLDMLWLKQRVISDNIANAETPGYKAKSVSFGNVLSREFYKANPEKIDELRPVITVDSSSIRPDGNNVSIERESLELWRTYAQYSYLRDKISRQFKNMRYVINNLG
jgi:flagellar basal-body rod protein FlgB